MSQTVIPPAPDDPVLAVMNRVPPSGVRPGPVARLRARVRDELEHTPGQLRVAAVLAVLATLIVALGGGAALRERSSALDEARDAAQHLVLVQSVQTRLAQANADATNSFLGFGLEPEAQRLDYINQVQQASRDLTLAARTNRSDANELGLANENLTRYTGYISSARANNRLGKPVGANYLNVAGEQLNIATTVLNKVAVRDGEALDHALARAGNARWWLVFAALVGVGGLLGLQLWLAQRSRRILSVPLAAATVIAVVALLLGAGAMAFAQSRANDVASGSLQTARDLSSSRVNTFQAKAQESLTLIARGSATDEDTQWKDFYNGARNALPRGDQAAAQALTAYGTAHTAINKLDVAGQWDQAVARATSVSDGSANAAFEQYDQATSDVSAQSREAVEGLDSAGTVLLPVGILIVLAGLVAAAGAWWGVSLRLDEYR